MTRTNNAHYLMTSVHSKDQTGTERISTDAKNGIRSSYVGLCATRVTGPLKCDSLHKVLKACRNINNPFI